MRIFVSTWHFMMAHPLLLVVLVAAVTLIVSRVVWWITIKMPRDRTGNGIAIGQAKVFDNRSLALRVERLSGELERLKVINQSITDNVSAAQAQVSTQSSQSLSFEVKAQGKPAQESKATTSDKSNDGKSSGSAALGTAKTDEPAPKVGLAASDLLNDQLNLASQIFNLQLLYERSLSDRMIDGEARLQAVLGFQVSIAPPAGYDDCVAVAEVEVRMRPAGPAAAPQPISLVALMPQEKTYNAETVSASERSIGGSAVARVLTLNVNSKSGSRQLFIHRDADTVAFERQPDAARGTIIFGWEFRPVLGRRTVAAGTRQMLSVVSIPVPDNANNLNPTLEIKTRSYWRKYNRKLQTSSPNWSWKLWKVDRSATYECPSQQLAVPNTAQIQSSLAPAITAIKWVNSGNGKATVIVKGKNFFSGTKVAIGGRVHREEDGSITLKSDQALEFETTIDSLTTGDGVLSGRFGPALQLSVPENVLPVSSLTIDRASIQPLRKSRAFRIKIDIVGWDNQGNRANLTVENFQNLPEPILFVGSEPVAMPYDFIDRKGTDPAEPKYVRVEAWIPSQTLSKSSSVSFRVPFCGFNYQSSQPLSFSDPTITRMGQDGNDTVFRIFYPQGFGSFTSPQGPSFNVELDKTYFDLPPGPPPPPPLPPPPPPAAAVVGMPGSAAAPAMAPLPAVPASAALTRISDTEYRFTVPNSLLTQYQNMVIRLGSGDPYLLPIPPADKIPPKPTIDTSGKPPQVVKTKLGPVEWSGAALDTITEVNFLQPVPSAPAIPLRQEFTTYAQGTRLLVYLSSVATAVEGKFGLECTTLTGEKLNLTLSVVAG